ncbi:MAG: MlaD family protein [Treponema sp.]|jgi:phospholipid/cholesterol/gamma-HCH transport system substrate-binding protein|nr:MlaD family protein [Treponema sp.]
MKFKIRFADQIVGVFIILALLVLIVSIFMLGRSKRWFVKDYQFRTYFDSANGLTVDMAVQYKGFTIGYVKSFRLSDDDSVEVFFSINKDYGNRVKLGSLVELDVSPIGLGNHFYFYSGLGSEELEDGSFVPTVNSSQGRTYIQMGLAQVPPKNDSISNLIAQTTSIMNNLNGTLAEIRSAIMGTDATTLGRTLGGVETAVDSINGGLQPVLTDIKRITSDLEQFTEKLDEPGGIVSAAFGPGGDAYVNLEASLKSVSGILRNLEKTTDYLPQEMPQIAGLVAELRKTLGSVEDVLTALLNNPLLKNGVPQRVQVESNGTSPRGIQF